MARCTSAIVASSMRKRDVRDGPDGCDCAAAATPASRNPVSSRPVAPLLERPRRTLTTPVMRCPPAHVFLRSSGAALRRRAATTYDNNHGRCPVIMRPQSPHDLHELDVAVVDTSIVIKRHEQEGRNESVAIEPVAVG